MNTLTWINKGYNRLNGDAFTLEELKQKDLIEAIFKSGRTFEEGLVLVKNRKK